MKYLPLLVFIHAAFLVIGIMMGMAPVPKVSASTLPICLLIAAGCCTAMCIGMWIANPPPK